MLKVGSSLSARGVSFFLASGATSLKPGRLPSLVLVSCHSHQRPRGVRQVRSPHRGGPERGHRQVCTRRASFFEARGGVCQQLYDRDRRPLLTEPARGDSGLCQGVAQIEDVVQRATSSSPSRMPSSLGSGGEASPKEEMQVDHQGNGPQKRRAPDDSTGGLSLETIREAIGEAIRGELHEVRKDIRNFAQRVDHVESQVTKQMQQTINLLDEMTNKHAEHGGILEQLQEANREVHARLDKLERGGTASSVAGSTAAPPSEGGRKPALIIGGWDADQEAQTTKREASDILKSVEAPIAMDNIFVPGVRRGYAILPVDERPGETFDQRKQQVQEVITKVRAANMHLGVRADGAPRRLWIAMSQPPERRRRARLAAKTKRLYLTLGGDKALLEMEYNTGSAWIEGHKVCSATASRPPGAEEAGPAG